jgi:tRNA threonylcarbamoyladenosine biosynthesis protein TsaE
VTSPTFVLVQEYEGLWPLYHFDTYRLVHPEAFADLGIDEYFSGAGVCFVEWADRVANLLPADHLRIEIETTGTHSRRFRVQSFGPRSARVVRRLQPGTEGA